MVGKSKTTTPNSDELKTPLIKTKDGEEEKKPSPRRQSYEELYQQSSQRSLAGGGGQTRNIGLIGWLFLALPRAPYPWPTIWVDLLSNAHLVIVWAFYVMDYESMCKKREWSNLTTLTTWHQIDYMQSVKDSPFNCYLFVLWTLQVLATIGVVHFHTTSPHHPKFYVGRANRFPIVCHIIGGSIADFGGYLGFCLGSTTIIKIASLAGIFLHIPSAFWQSRNLHGRRELMQPLYYFLDFFLLLKYVDVWAERGSFASVITMGFAVNMFALVRVYFKCILLIGMDYDTSYDVAILLAMITNLPILLGPTGCIQLVSVIFLWNILLGALLPGYRQLLEVNRTVADVFPDKFGGKPMNFKQELRKYKKLYPKDNDDRVTVARATFHVIAGDNNTIELEEVEELFEGWGLPDGKTIAKQVFDDADENNDGIIDFEEFQNKLGFIWERIYCVGEAETDEDGFVTTTSMQDLSISGKQL